jgi:hypothetical protein
MWRLTQNNLGIMFFSLEKMEKAMTFLDQSLPIYKKMAKKRTFFGTLLA